MASTTVGRNLSALEQAIKANKDALKETNIELKALDKALKLDPSNAELLSQKFEVFGRQSDLSKQSITNLGQEMDILKAKLDAGAISEEFYNQELAKLEQQSKLAEIQVDGLTGAIDRQDQAMQKQKWDAQRVGMEKATKAMQTYQAVLSGVTAIQSGLSNLINNWRDMNWFEKVIQGMTIAVGALATAMAIFKFTLNPFQIGITLAAITGGALAIGALLGNNKSDSGSVANSSSGSNYIDTSVYSNQLDSYTSNSIAKSTQGTSSEVKLTIDVQGGNEYNMHMASDIGKELIGSKTFMDSLGNALGKRVIG